MCIWSGHAADDARIVHLLSRASIYIVPRIAPVDVDQAESEACETKGDEFDFGTALENNEVFTVAFSHSRMVVEQV